MRTRRVGSITCGSLLILFGGLFFAHLFVPAITYTLIFRLWPLVLVLLGVEILLSNFRAGEENLKYDVGAVFLILILAVFAMAMGGLEYLMDYGEAWGVSVNL